MSDGFENDVRALARVIHGVPGVECSHVPDKVPCCRRDAEAIVAAGWSKTRRARRVL